MTNYTIKLYYANWCGHCVKFKPVWNKLKTLLSKVKKDKNGNDVSFTTYEFEESENPSKMDEANVTSFPTIHIYKDDDTTPILYNKDRTIDEFAKYFNVDINMQSGGSDEYYKKYMKYKLKYLMAK